MKALDKLKEAEWDTTLYCDRERTEETFGHNPDYLLETHGLTKSDLIRLERSGLAMKARYVTRNKTGRYTSVLTAMDDGTQGIEKIPVDGPHRTRWIIFKKES